jgi:hypothetical protein
VGFLFELFRKKPAVEVAPVAPGFRRIESVRLWHARTPQAVRVLELDGDVLWEGWTKPGQRPDERAATRYPSPTAARTAFDELLRVAVGNFGEHERTVRDVPLSKWKAGEAPFASDPAQEAALDSAPDDVALARVYTDWLVGHGDARGELFALAAERRLDEVEQYLEVNGAAMLGSLELARGAELGSLEWNAGLLTGARLKRRLDDSPLLLAEVTRQFLALPLSRFVTSLRFGLASYAGDNDWAETLAVVGSSSRAPFLRSLRFDDFTREESEISWTSYGDLSVLWAPFVRLEELRIRAGGEGVLGRLEFPRLKRFARETGGLRNDELDAILSAKWPLLEQLEIWFGDPNYGAQVDAGRLESFLKGGHPPKLRALGLMNCDFAGELLPLVLGSPLLPALRSLDLSMGVLGDEHVDALLAARLGHLEVLNLESNAFSPEACARLKAALPLAKLGDQNPAAERYVSVGE